MANPTTNFGWVMPTSTSLVTNLPADFNTFGQAVDTSMAQLKGGTTGQILSKTSATDMAFTWITNDVGDITAVTAGTGISGGGTSGAVTITNSMATEIAAKGDLIVGTGSATFDNLGVGTNGQVLTADSTVSPTGLKWATPSSGSTFVGASVYKSANQSITSGVVTNVSFDTENYDTNAFHDNSTNNSRMTIPTGYGGKYLITAKFYYDGNAAGYREIGIKKNGTQVNFFYFGPNTTYTTQQGSVVLSLAAADYVELTAYQNTGGALNIFSGSDSTFFQISYLGA